MTQLRSCYFCGTTGELSEYGTVPPDVLSDDEQPPRVVLCSRCHTKLTNVLTPLVERLGWTDDRDGTPSAAESVAADPPTDGGGPASQQSPDQAEVTFSQGTPDDSDRDPASEREGTRASADASDQSDATVDRMRSNDAGDGDGSVPTTGTEATAADISETTETTEAPHDAETADRDDDVEAPDDPASASPPDHLERVYHKLLRFLRNREFPVPRAEAETIAQSAYDLSASEAADVIQLTIDRDVLEERDGELHRR